MKKLIILISILIAEVFFGTAIYACDGCGPSSGCNYMGVLPNFRKNFIGVRYNDRAFVTEPYKIRTDQMSARTTDRYFTAEVWGRFFVSERMQIIGILPYARHTRNDGGTPIQINGFGDAIALANYTVFASKDSVITEWSHFVQAGGGIKLPTGNFRNGSNGHIYHANFQTGSGSTDFLANAAYTLRYNKFGLRTDVFYKYNTANADEYTFGNRLSNNNSLFYWASFDGDNAIVPQLGLYQEQAGKDVSRGYFESNTGGLTRMLTCAVDVYYSRLAFGVNYMHPLQQPQYSIPTKMQHSFRTYINYFF